MFRNERAYRRELAVYERLDERTLQRVRGFNIPALIESDDQNFVLVIGHVDPPYIIDFGAAGLDERPADFQLESEDWNAEKQRVYGPVDWPEIRRLLESLMQHGIFYTDVHQGNIRVRRER